jgi:succinate-semialdehyde dehydrogenase/glutarate-semialdehyde dehydrogenase
MDEHTRAPERDQSQSREPANAPDERPRFQTNDPATGQSGRAYEGHTRDEALGIAQQARQAFIDWRRTSFSHRASFMKEARRCCGAGRRSSPRS